ncbi:MAG: hypothetical protein WBD20_03145 [Pirellulaceae bacterium]
MNALNNDRPTCLTWNRSLLGVAATLIFLATASAQVSTTERQVITDSLRDAAKSLDLDQLTEIDDAKQDVLKQIKETNDFVDRASSGDNRNGWLEYLKLDPVTSAIQDDASYAKLYRESVALKQRLYGTAKGLEFSKFRQLRDSLDRLIPALKYSKKELVTEVLAKRINTDADDLDDMSSIPTVEELTTVNRLMELLIETNQSGPVADVLRRNFGHPNVSVWVGEGVVQRVVCRPVHESKPVIDCILGTSINGQATLTGTVSADLFPSHGAVGLNVSLAGQVYTRSRGYHKPVSLITTGYGDVSASRALYVSEAGISMEPTYAQAQLRTEINSINHRFRFVRRIAARKAAETKPQAEQIGVEKLRIQVGEQFAQQVAEAGSVPIPDVMQKVRPVLLRLDIPEPSRMIGSTDQSVYFHTIVQRDDQLAAPNPAPPFSLSYDAAIQIHETAINNTLGHLLAGRTVNQTQIDELMSGMGQPPQSREAPGSAVLAKDKDNADGKDEEDEPPFEVDFDKSRPIIFEARDGKLRIGIRGTRFEQGTRGIKEKLEIAATYVPGTKSDGAMILVREGEVEISFPGTKRNTIGQSATKGAIEKNFATVFPETLLHQPITLPQSVKAEALRGQVYRPRMIEAKDGWLTVALQ